MCSKSATWLLALTRQDLLARCMYLVPRNRSAAPQQDMGRLGSDQRDAGRSTCGARKKPCGHVSGVQEACGCVGRATHDLQRRPRCTHLALLTGDLPRLRTWNGCV